MTSRADDFQFLFPLTAGDFGGGVAVVRRWKQVNDLLVVDFHHAQFHLVLVLAQWVHGATSDGVWGEGGGTESMQRMSVQL